MTGVTSELSRSMTFRGRSIWLGYDLITEDSLTWLDGSLVISDGGITQVTMMTKVTWGFRTQLLLRSGTHEGLNVKCPLCLSEFMQN
jgi:hypothetical protein